ncbi:hypothetical protein B0H17DRAFT_1081103 [Mycena rosella]|uniref:Uncharacterized protein n=1 Tax=Mycena rosella TaxID=1033263 RepID=A0AAD7D2Q6_MYCRO|nr:hypothetical protein B0H17DRAFT_1081103 [Mycena rosella]
MAVFASAKTPDGAYFCPPPSQCRSHPSRALLLSIKPPLPLFARWSNQNQDPVVPNLQTRTAVNIVLELISARRWSLNQANSLKVFQSPSAHPLPPRYLHYQRSASVDRSAPSGHSLVDMVLHTGNPSTNGAPSIPANLYSFSRTFSPPIVSGFGIRFTYHGRYISDRIRDARTPFTGHGYNLRGCVACILMGNYFFSGVDASTAHYTSWITGVVTSVLVPAIYSLLEHHCDAFETSIALDSLIYAYVPPSRHHH